jgi:tetratricopeptide (TPR) repeat protein
VRAWFITFLFALATASPAMALDLTSLWDFKQPVISEARFKQALQTASGDEALILQTQIARTHGLRKDFDGARRLLLKIQPAVMQAGPEVQVRYHLEWGRSLASATHQAAQITPEAAAEARRAYETALRLAQESRLDGLAVDAIHMFAFLDPAPAEQLKWGLAALDVALATSQPAAQRWEATARHNVGIALHQLARFDEALPQFERARVLREQGGDADAIHVAHWMVGWTLRSLKRTDEALTIQRRLEQAADAAGKPDHHVFAELEALFRERGDASKADYYADRKRTAAPP